MPSGKRHYRVTLEDAHAADAEALRFGGRPGVLDAGRIAQCIPRPRPSSRLSPQNHGFVDGNKRTALLTYLLVRMSGYRLAPANPREDVVRAFEELAVAVASGELQLPEITQWFKLRLSRE